MEVAAPAPAPSPAPTAGDGRFQLDPMAREVMKKQIMKTLRKYLPVTGSEGPSILQSIAEGFEEKFYNTATSESSYSRKIAMLLLYVETPNQNPNHRDGKSKAPMLKSPGEKIIEQEFQDNSLFPPTSDDEPQHPGNDTADTFGSANSYKDPNMYSRAHLSILENNADGKGKAPMPESPRDETIDEEFWYSTLYQPASDDEPQHPGTDTADTFELGQLACPFENIQPMEDTSAVADPVSSELPDDCGFYLDTLEVEGLNSVCKYDGATNLKKRKFDGASSSSAHVFEQGPSHLWSSG